MNRKQKAQAIEELHEIFSKAQSIIIVHYRGLTVNDTNELRLKFREANASFKVIKNTLTSIALKDSPFEAISSIFKGPVAIGWSELDPISPARIINNFVKDNEKLVIIGGGAFGKVMSVKDVVLLANMPSLDELRAKMIGIISTPAKNIASILQAPAGNLARVFNAYARKQ